MVGNLLAKVATGVMPKPVIWTLPYAYPAGRPTPESA
jgi:hypothetical protein